MFVRFIQKYLIMVTTNSSKNKTKMTMYFGQFYKSDAPFLGNPYMYPI